MEVLNMVRFVPNPDFRIEDAIEGAKGKFTCPNCGKDFEQTIQRLEDGKIGVVCPGCDLPLELKTRPDKAI